MKNSIKNPIATIANKLRVRSAMNTATGMLEDPNYKGAPDRQKFIELVDVRRGLRNIVEGDANALDANRVMDEFKASKLHDIMTNLVHLVQDEDGAAAEKSLELLSQYYGYPSASRYGGVPEELAQGMIDHNARIDENGVAIPQTLIDKAESLYAEQITWLNTERYDRVVAAIQSLHERYPADFMHEINNPAAADKFFAESVGYKPPA